MTAEIMSDPMQPLRFEKKRNMNRQPYPAALHPTRASVTGG